MPAMYGTNVSPTCRIRSHVGFSRDLLVMFHNVFLLNTAQMSGSWCSIWWNVMFVLVDLSQYFMWMTSFFGLSLFFSRPFTVFHLDCMCSFTCNISYGRALKVRQQILLKCYLCLFVHCLPRREFSQIIIVMVKLRCSSVSEFPRGKKSKCSFVSIMVAPLLQQKELASSLKDQTRMNNLYYRCNIFIFL